MNGFSNSQKFKTHFEEQISDEGQNLVLEFFLTFSRFECALKNSIIYASLRRNSVEPNWDLFVSDIRGSFNVEGNVQLSEAVAYLLSNPPKIQQLKDGAILWEDRVFQENEPELNRLCLSIRDVRNNLMHGGKFQGRYEPDISRNYILLKSSVTILNEWLELSEDIKQLFHERIS